MTAWVLPVAVGAVIGYATNWLAIKMLFWPRREYRFLDVHVPFTPGLFVKRRADFTRSISLIVEARFATVDDLVAAFFRAQEQGLISKFVDDMGPLFKVGWNIYCARMRPGDFKKDCEKLMSKIREKNVVAETMENKLNAMDMAEIEKLVLEISARELSAITWLGAVLGAVIGGVQGLF